MFFDEEFINNFNQFASTPFDESAVINKNTSADFFKTYLKIATNLDEKNLEVLLYMIKNANEKGIFEGTYDKLVEDLNISRSTLASVMTHLQQMRFIFKHPQGWLISDTFTSIPQNTNIIVRFTSPKNVAVKKQEMFNFDAFSLFLNEYFKSYENLNSVKDLNKQMIDDNIKLLADDYKKKNLDSTFYNFVKDSDIKETNIKDFTLKAVKNFEKLSKTNKKYVADIENDSFAETKKRYMDLIDRLSTDLSGETKTLIKAIVTVVLNIAKEIGSCDATKIKNMLTNKEYGRKIIMEAPLIIKSSPNTGSKLIEYFRIYENYVNKPSMVADVIKALVILHDDEFVTVRYE